MKTVPGYLLAIFCALQLAACSSAFRWHPDYHTVRSGETLYSIAMQYNLDQRQLAGWNHLGSGTYIREGQQLRLTPPSGYSSKQGKDRTPEPSASSAAILPAPAWRWPTSGSVSLYFGASSKTQSGIRIGGTEGQSVRATAAGEVVYAGTGLRSYGQLLILKHNDTWLSAYGFNSKLQVKEGDRVKTGQMIAEMGHDSGGRPLLHFEIRKNGQPVDPLRYLPRR